MEHTNKNGQPKLVQRCTLPLTGKRVVHEVMTDLGYFRVGADGLHLAELAPGVSVAEIESKTGCAFTVADPLPTIQL
jgi:acyl CoA:acetate/3-ketoacid CoA transferase beta subunit